MGTMLVCDNCKHSFELPPLKYRRDSGLEVSYFKCDVCGAEYVATVKDKDLIKSLRRYKHWIHSMAITIAGGGKVPENETMAVQDMLKENKKRGIELRDDYIRRRSHAEIGN